MSEPSTVCPDVVLSLSDVSVTREKRTILAPFSWQVRSGERWIVLGPNGSGKTTLCLLASLYLHPTDGTIEVLGQSLGQTDVTTLRTRLGFTSAALTDRLRPDFRVMDVVVMGRYAALAPWWHRYTDDDRARARDLLARFDCAHLADRFLGTLSSGERQRVLFARTLMGEPELWLLDEPTAGLDLGGRERLVALLGRVAHEATPRAIVLVTHHVDEIPPGFTHALVLAAGRVLAAGPIAETITDETLTACFELPLAIERRDGRWLAWAAQPAGLG